MAVESSWVGDDENGLILEIDIFLHWMVGGSGLELEVEVWHFPGISVHQRLRSFAFFAPDNPRPVS
jgi:hypothetical protein